MDKPANTISSSGEDETDELAGWKRCNSVVIYDANSLNMEDATNAVAILDKLKPEDWDGQYYVLRGEIIEAIWI